MARARGVLAGLMAVVCWITCLDPAYATENGGAKYRKEGDRTSVEVDITAASHPPGVYKLGPAFRVADINVDFGSTLSAELFACDLEDADANGNGTVDAEAGCVSLTAITADVALTDVRITRRYLILDVNTAEGASTVSRLTMFGSFTVGGGGGAPAAEYAALSAIDQTTVSHVTVIDCDDLTCADPGGGTTHVPFYHNGSNWVPFPGAAAGIASVSADGSPALGGNLDAQGNDITNVGLMQADVIGEVYYCDQFAGADLWAQCQAAYAQAKADGVRMPVIEAPRGAFTVAGAKLDFCDESGPFGTTGGIFRGQGGGPSVAASHRAGTAVTAGAGFASTNIARTNFTITVDVDTDGAGPETTLRDEITCTGCDFLAAGITRGSLIETSGFASSANNYSKANGKMPLKVYSATATKLVVEDERSANASMVAVSNVAAGELRLLKPMIETCGGTWIVQGITLDADGVADIGVHHRPDNQPYRACTGVDAPYDGTGEFALDCTGFQTANTLGANISIGGGLLNVWVYDATYASVAHTALEIGGQSDHWTIEDGSHLSGGLMSFWYDGLQAQPGVIIRDSQLEAFQRHGVRLSSGMVLLDNATVISADADCKADTFGESAHVWVGYENVTGMKFDGETNLEVKCGKGIHIANGGANQNALRAIDISHSWITANDPDVTNLIDAPNACLAVDIEGAQIKDNNGPAGGPTLLTFGNSNQGGACSGWIAGKATYSDMGPAGFVPSLVVNDGIPVGVMSDSFIASINGGTPNGAGASVHWSELTGVPAGFADGTDDGSGGGGDEIEIDGVAASSPVDFRSDGDIDAILCTGAGAPDAACAAAGDVIQRVKADSVALGTDTTGNYAGSSSEGGAATTAVALAANGANCSAGEYPLGVNAAGAVESCTDATTEINSVVATKSAATNAADGNIPRFDGTAGDLQDSGCNIDDDGVLTCPDQTAEPGNLLAIHDNDTAFTNDPTCANSGTAGMLTIIDKDESASDDWVVCDGTTELGSLADLGTGATPTHTECFPFYAPTDTIADSDDVQSLWRAPAAITITEVWCETDTGTVNMDLQIDDGTPADVMGTDLVCASTAVSDSSGLTGAMADGDRLDLAITSVASSPTRLTVCAEYTYD